MNPVREKPCFFKLVDGLRPVDPAELVEYERAMIEEVIPEIIKAIRRREYLADQARKGLYPVSFPRQYPESFPPFPCG